MAKVNNPIRSRVSSRKTRIAPTEPSGTVWPNGEFTLGVVRDYEKARREEEWKWCQDCPEDNPQDIDKTGWPLSLSNALNSHKLPSSSVRGHVRGITPHGRKMIKSGAYLMEKKLGKRDLAFVTLTCPSLEYDERKAVARGWGELGRQLSQFIQRRLIARGRSPALCGVTEIQERRLRNSGDAYLHYHLVFPAHANKNGFWALEQEDLQEWWQSALSRVIGRDLGQRPRVEMKVVRKSAEGYLGKYMSKGSGTSLDEFIEDLGIECVPGQWWLMSKCLRDYIREKKCCGRTTGALMECWIMQAAVEKKGNIFERLVPIFFDTGGLKIQIGWQGRLYPDAWEEFYSLVPRA